MNEETKEKREWIWRGGLIALLLMALGGMLYYGNRKEGYHVDELYSYGLANSEYLPFMHFGDMEYSVKDWMLEYGAGENLFDLTKNLLKDYRILSENGFRIKESEIYQAYLRAQANSADTRTTTWVSGQDYLDYLAASRTNRFNYASVYYNQRGDVHPPLFYLILHTVCSFFPEHFSKWLGLIPNFCYMMLALALLYRLVSRHLGGRGFALAVTGAFALSQGMVTTAVFLRMYALLTLMVLWCFALHLELLENQGKLSKSLHRRLLLSALLGYLTHYYFVLYIMMAALVVSIALMFHKKWKMLLRYVLTMMEAAFLGLVIWPFSIKHVFLGYRGRDSLETLGSFQFSIWRLKYLFEMFADSMLGGSRWLLYGLLIVIIFGILVACAVLKIHCKDAVQGRRSAEAAEIVSTLAETAGNAEMSAEDAGKVEASVGDAEKAEISAGDAGNAGKIVTSTQNTANGMAPEKMALTVAPAAFYFITTSQIIPFLDFRYEYCLYPFMVIFLVCGSGWMACELRKAFPKIPARAQWIAVALVSALLAVLGNYVVKKPGWIAEGGQEKTPVAARTVCVYVLPDGDWNESANETNVLAKCEKVAVIYESNLEVLRGTYSYEEGQTVMVAVHDSLDVDMVAARVKDVLGIERLTEKGRMRQSNTSKVLYGQ